MRRTLTTTLAAVAALALAAPAVAGPPERTSIVDAAIAVNAASGEFDELIDAVLYTELAGVLDGNRQFTVFAPTDAAFETLYVALGIDSIRDLPKDVVTQVLLYHVAPGERFAADVVESDRIRTMDKSFADIAVTMDGVFIDQAEIVAPDAADVDNGVIHIIDAVILPF
jgi:transforming growth factor-beta-induced protein